MVHHKQEGDFMQEPHEESLSIFEQELILAFQTHHAKGNRWYSNDLKEKIFKAYEHGMTPSKVIQLCEIPSYLAYRWNQIFCQREAERIKQPISKNFRAIRILNTLEEEEKNDLKNSTENVVEKTEVKNISIRFPNGVEITGGLNLFSQRFLNELYLLKG